MTTRYYDLSENVVPNQGGEAIADTPSGESPSESTDEKRNDGKITDPTSLDSNPATEDGERTPDSRTDVTSLAARRAEAKRPKLSHQDFSNVCKFIDRTSSANPHVDFGKVVVHAVREYAHRANKNALTVLAAVVPILISSGNFDITDRESLINLNNQIRQAQSPKKGDASGPSKESPPESGTTNADAAAGLADGAAAGSSAMSDAMGGGSGGAPPMDADPSAGGGGLPSDPGGVGGSLGDMFGGDAGIANSLGDMGAPGGGGMFNSPTGPPGGQLDPMSQLGLGDPSGMEKGLSAGPSAGGDPSGGSMLAPPGGPDVQPLGTADPNTQINLARQKRALGEEPPAPAIGDTLNNIGDTAAGIPGQMLDNFTEGMGSTVNTLGQDAAQEVGGALGLPGGQSGQDFAGDLSNGVSNTFTNMGEDLKQDASQALGLSTPGTGLHKPLGNVKRGRSMKHANGVLHFDHGGPDAPVPVTHLQDHGDGTSLIHNETGQPEAVNNEDLYHDQQMQQPVTQEHPRDQLPETSPQKKKDDGPPGQQAPAQQAPAQQPPAQKAPPQSPPQPPAAPPNQQQYPTPNKDSRRRASGDTNADGADPEDVREENKDNAVNPNDSFSRDPGDDLRDSKSAAFSRRADFPSSNLDAAKRDTDTQDPEKPVNDTTSDDAQSSQYDRGKYDQNGPLLTNPDKSTDQNWPPKASAVDAIRLADMYVDFGLIAPEQKYQVVAGFEKMNSFIVKDRLKVLTAVAGVKRPERNRALVPQAGNMPSMQQGTSLKNASRTNGADLDHFLAL